MSLTEHRQPLCSALRLPLNHQTTVTSILVLARPYNAIIKVVFQTHSFLNSVPDSTFFSISFSFDAWCQWTSCAGRATPLECRCRRLGCGPNDYFLFHVRILEPVVAPIRFLWTVFGQRHGWYIATWLIGGTMIGVCLAWGFGSAWWRRR